MRRFISNRKVLSKILNWIYVLIILLFLLDALKLVEIKNQSLKSFIYIGLIIGTPLILIWNLFAHTTIRYKIAGLILPVCAIVFIIITSPMKILFSTGAWQTQTILYENGHFGFKTIEYQMQDVGAMGYQKRTVEVLYLTKLFMIVRPVSKNMNAGVEWIKVDKDVNELGLKY